MENTPEKPVLPIEEMSFEQALEQLEQLVQRMETGRLPLEALVRAYEQGHKLAAHCRTRLGSLEQKIELLNPAEIAAETAPAAGSDENVPF